MEMYILNTPAHMYIVHTLSVKNVRDGGLYETDEDDGWEGGHSILRRGSHGEYVICCSYMGNNQMLDKVGVIIGLD